MMTLGQNHRNLYLITIAVFLCLFAADCTTTSKVPATYWSTLATRIEPGDKVTITKSDGQEVKFKVTEVNNQGITGDGQYVAYADMREVLLTEYDSEKTTELVIGVAGTAAVGYFVIREFAKTLQSIPAY
jgi:protein involved in polysaccharide export with SLBB domain